MTPIDAWFVLTPRKTMFEKNDRPGEIMRNNGIKGGLCYNLLSVLFYNIFRDLDEIYKKMSLKPKHHTE